MEQVTGEIVFWLLALGTVVGWIAQLVMGEKGFGMVPNLLGGAIGSLVIGLLALQLNMPGSLLFGFLGCMSILFLANVFSVGDAHDTGMQISNNKR
ncbi:MAG: hypothetical protein R3281_06825 [Balneolaceae bacterium]|nr:hypothetical protein [Balneolaceae bacterium]